MIVVALLAALVGALAAAPASADRLRPPGKKAQHIKSQLQKRLEARGLENVDIRRCLIDRKKVRGKNAVLCTWYAEGILPGPQPYRCHGDALHGKLSTGRVGFVRISTCANKAPVQMPISPEPVHEPGFGYNEDFHTPSTLALIDLYDRLQPEYARWVFDWAAVERERGRYDWRIYDEAYAALNARGIRPIWAIASAPCFYQDNPCRTAGRPAAEHYDEMAKFAAALARRYPNIAAFEVLNEPNIGKYWGGIPEPDLYAKLFIEVEKAVQEADPDLPVLFGSMSPHAEADENTVPAAEFLAQGYDLGAVQRSDGGRRVDVRRPRLLAGGAGAGAGADLRHRPPHSAGRDAGLPPLPRRPGGQRARAGLRRRRHERPTEARLLRDRRDPRIERLLIR
jgi:hypothetical protein